MRDDTPRRRDEDEREFDAAVLLGLAPAGGRSGTRKSLSQADLIDQLRDVARPVMMDALPPAMEEGLRRIEKRHATLSLIVVGSLVVTALAAIVIAAVLVMDR